MDSLWKSADTLFEVMGKNLAVVIAAVGIGLVRTVFGWLLGPGATAADLFDPHLLIDVGEIAVFLTFAALVGRRGALSRHSWPILLAVGALGLALVLASSSLAPTLPAPLAAVGCVAAGVFYACLLLVWLEACGCMAPLHAVLAIAGSYVVSLLGWVTLRPFDTAAGMVAVCVAAVAAAAFLVGVYRVLPAESHPALRVEAGPSSRTVVSARMVGWVALMSLVYGFGDTFTQMGFATWASKVGMALPLLVIAAALFVARDRFDLRMLYRLSLVLMGVGVVPAVLLGMLHNTSQVLMSAAQAGTVIVSCAFACTSARRRHESAIFGCGILQAVALASTLVGNYAGSAFVDVGFALSEPMARFAGVMMSAAVVFLAAFLMRDEDLASLVVGVPELTDAKAAGKAAVQVGHAAGAFAAPSRAEVSHMAEASSSTPSQLVSSAGLSKREMAVFALMVQGKSVAQICDELFIAPGTVRAHMSRIYDKLGVHTRKEFEALLGLEG